jgi:ubiquinone/menaquinone biosynthesis C-methylase UbiE
MKIHEALNILGGRFIYMGESVDSLIKELNIPITTNILDIGTGGGRMAVLLALNGYTVLTGEPKEDDSKWAKRDWQNNAEKVGVGDRISFRHFNAEDMPFENGKFEAVFCFGSFHHIANKTKMLQECLRVIKENGLICIIEPASHIIQGIRDDHPEHPNGADPRDFIDNLPLNVKYVTKENIDVYILKMIETQQ